MWGPSDPLSVLRMRGMDVEEYRLRWIVICGSRLLLLVVLLTSDQVEPTLLYSIVKPASAEWLKATFTHALHVSRFPKY